jgi:hypothetical protein
LIDHPIDDVEGLSQSDKTTLKGHQIHYAEDFWARMAKDEALIGSLGFPDEESKKRIIGSLAQFAGKRADSITQPTLIVHIPDLFLLVGIVLVSYWIFLSGQAPPKPELAQQVVVAARDGLLPYRVIRNADVAIRPSIKNSSALTSIDAVVGRYVTEPIAEGTVIDRSKLSSGPALTNELDGLRLLYIKLQSSPILANLKPPLKLGIVPSPRAKDAGIEPKIFDVYVLKLDAQSDGIAAVIAATTADSEKLASFLGRADLVVAAALH